MAWDYSIGNLAERSRYAAAPVAPATEDSLLALENLSNGYPDQEAALTWRSDGTYGIDVDLNMLANESERSDAPTGWRDLLLDLAGTPGLSSFPPDWATYAARTALRLFRPVMQEFEVTPGEDFTLRTGIRIPAASTATGIQVEVIDLWSGLGWNGAAWVSGGIFDTQSVDDTWKDTSNVVTADTNRTTRSTYRVIVSPIASSYDATTYVYLSDSGASGSPAMYGAVDFAALIGHNIPKSATVTLGAITFSPILPLSTSGTCASTYAKTWTLSVVMPAGNQVRPKIGELWVGKLRVAERGVDPDIEVKEGDPAQVRVVAAQGRQEVMSDQRVPNGALTLKVRTFTDTAYAQYKEEILRGTRFGADPILLVPPAELDGTGRLIHGRVGSTVSYTHKEAGWREFQVELQESPFSNS